MSQSKPSRNTRATLRVILALAWPTMLEQTMQSAVQYIDTAMVGTLGTQATAAVGATSTVGFLVLSSVIAFSIGFLALIARACGAEDRDTAQRASAQALLTVLVLGSALTVLTVALSGMIPSWMQVEPHIRSTASRYFLILCLPMLPRTASIIFGTALRAAGDTRTPMKVSVLMNCINVILNFLLIYPTRTVLLFGRSVLIPGAGWGVEGAAIASAIAITWGGFRITRVLWHHPVISPRGRELRPDKDILASCIRVAFPNMLQRFGTSLGFVVFSAMINSLGEVATAAHTIANTVESAFYIPGYGMQTAASTLTGNAYGAGDNKRMKELTSLFLPVEVFLMCVTGGALFLSAPALMRVFSSSPEVIGLGTTVLRMVAISEPMYGVSIIVEGILIGVGQTKLPFLYNIIGMWCVRIIGTFICTQVLEFGLISAWACMIAHNALVFVLYTRTYVSGRWNPLRGSGEGEAVTAGSQGSGQ